MAIKHFWYKLYAKQGMLYKLFLAVVLVTAIIFLLPKGSFPMSFRQVSLGYTLHYMLPLTLL